MKVYIMSYSCCIPFLEILFFLFPGTAAWITYCQGKGIVHIFFRIKSQIWIELIVWLLLALMTCTSHCFSDIYLVIIYILK